MYVEYIREQIRLENEANGGDDDENSSYDE